MSHHPFKWEERKSNNEGALDGEGRCLGIFLGGGRGGVILKGTESSFGVRLSVERCGERWSKVDLQKAPTADRI